MQKTKQQTYNGKEVKLRGQVCTAAKVNVRSLP
jgi:hypothetical protein